MDSTETPVPRTEFFCVKCSGELHPGEGQLFLTCPYCGSAVYLDKSKVVFHWSLNRTVTADAALANLRRWMAGNHTVKDLDRKSQIASGAFQYFPLWYVRALDSGRERVFIERGAATSISELKHLDIPAGDLQKYDPALDGEALYPTVPFPALLNFLSHQGVQPEEVVEAALVHVPVYTFKYQFAGRPYVAIVEGATGKVFANLFPEKAESPYFLVAAVATVGFLCVSSFPVIGYAMEGMSGLGLGLLACLAGGAIFALPIFALAAFISAKI